MNNTQLQIVISVLNNAADQLSEVGSQIADLADQTSTSASEMSDSMADAGDAISTMTEQTDADLQALADASVAATQSWMGAMSDIEETASAVPASITSSWANLSDVSAETAAQVSEQWAAASAAAETDLADMLSEADTQFAKTAAVAETAGEEMESSISSVGGKFQAVGIQAGLIGAAFFAPVVESVSDAADKTQALAEGLNTINNIINTASGPNPGAATQIASLTAQINAQQASIAEDDAALQKWTGTTAEVGAAHEKAAASIATANINIAKLQAELTPLTSQEDLVGQSAQGISNSFSALATQNTNLGISFEDSYNALVAFLDQTKNVSDATAMYGAAVDLVASGKIPDMTTAVQDVTQAFNGMGRGLQQVVPDMRDGVSGMTAINEITASLAGSPAVALQQYNTQMAALGQHTNDLGAAMANGLLPQLTQFLTTVNEIIDKLTEWFTAHQKAGEVLLIFMGIVGGALIVLGAILLPLGMLIIATEALNTALALLGITAGVTLGAVMLYIGVFIAMAAIVALVIVYHQQIIDAIKAAWDAIVSFVQDHWQAILNILMPGMSTLVAFLFDNWGTIKNDVETAWNAIENFISGIWNKIVTDAQTAVTTIQNLLNKLMAPINAVTGTLSSISSTLGNAGSAVVSALPHFATGGIVNGPTLALVGEAGPEAIIPLSAFNGGPSLGGGGGGIAGGITININGGSYLNQGGAQQIAQALATMIGRQLKLTTV